MTDSEKIVKRAKATESDANRGFAIPLVELARELDIPLERAEFLALQLESRGEISVAGIDPRTMIVAA